MSTSLEPSAKPRRNINLESSARGGRATRKSHRVAHNFVNFLGTESSVPVTPVSLDEILLKLKLADSCGKHYAVVVKSSSRRKRAKLQSNQCAYATTLLEYDPTPNGLPPRIFRATHTHPLRWALIRIEAQSNGHVVALHKTQHFSPTSRAQNCAAQV
jgi:hypothetical protein